MASPGILGVHHLKFAVADLERSQTFYERVFDAKRLTHFDHRRPDNGELFAVILDLPNLGTMLELRRNPGQAAAHRGFDPVTLSVQGPKDLEAWAAHLDALGIEHSPVLAGMIGWLLVVRDPDQRPIRFYTLDTHGPEVPMTYDADWLGPM
jgi:catechol 2,3-dioxygenase-like lactoylglutathione lyase family enzyme